MLVRYFVKCPLIWVYLMFPSGWHWGYRFGRDSVTEMKSLSHPIVRHGRAWYQNDFLNLGDLEKVVLESSLPGKLFIYLFSFPDSIWKWTWSYSRMLGRKFFLTPVSWRGKSLQIPFGTLHIYLCHTLGYNPILCNLFYCLRCSIFGHWSSSWLVKA